MRAILHLACFGKLISHCPTVSEDIRKREDASVLLKTNQKRKRSIDRAAVEAASMARQVTHAKTAEAEAVPGNRHHAPWQSANATTDERPNGLRRCPQLGTAQQGADGFLMHACTVSQPLGFGQVHAHPGAGVEDVCWVYATVVPQ